MAIGLAMVCCAVSTVQGLTHRTWHPQALLMACIFGCFHMGMPIIGYYAGTLFVNFMQTYAPWIALALLGFLGVKMIWESYHEEEDAESDNAPQQQDEVRPCAHRSQAGRVERQEEQHSDGA